MSPSPEGPALPSGGNPVDEGDAPALRLLEVGDVARVVALEEAIFPEDPWTEGMISEELQVRGRHYVGVEVGDRLVGYAGITLGSDADVMTVGVLPEARGRGLGRLLVEDLLAAARRAGARRVFLEVRASNEVAIGLYARLGFARIGRIRRYFRHPSEDAVTMRADLVIDPVTGTAPDLVTGTTADPATDRIPTGDARP